MKIAFIGTGKIAQRHLAALTTLPDMEVVGHTSPNPASVEAAVSRWGGRGYPDLDRLVENETIDAAWVTVPPDQHGDIEYRLLEEGIPFLVEKPLSADRQTAVDIAHVIREKKAIVGVGYNWRALDTLPSVRAALADHPARMVVGSWHGVTPDTSWWIHQESSGGQFIEQTTHLIDLARSLLGDAAVVSSLAGQHFRPEYPDADIAGASAALLKFPNETVGVFSATCLLAPGSSEVRLQIICDGLSITITQAQVTYDYGRERHEFKTQANAYLVQNLAFVQAVQQRDPTRLYCSYEDALKTHHLCHDILERSAET